MLPTLMAEAGDYGLLIGVPVTILIAWVYFMMEAIGDFSENPFQGVMWDIPMLSLCRTIEIDLREMLKETDLPNPVQSHDDILM